MKQFGSTFSMNSARLLLWAMLAGSANAQTYTLSDYYYPFSPANEWIYREPNDSSSTTIVRILETNHAVTCYSDCSPVLPYNRSVVSVNFIQGNVISGGGFEVDNSWTNYLAAPGTGWGWVGFDHVEGTRWRFEPGLVFTNQFVVGQSVSITNMVYDHGVCAGQGTLSVQLVGFSDIQVPAGFFPNCMHLKLSYNILGETTDEDHWWAEGVGTVKFTHGRGGSAETNELNTYTVHAQAPPFQWARRVAGTINSDNELAIGLAIDSEGNLHVTGWFDGTNDFGNGIVLTNTPGGGQDMFVAKYNSAGVALWARQGGGNTPEWDGGRGIGLDDAGNVYVAGQFYGNAAFDGLSLEGSNNARFFLAKYNNDGTIQWVRQSVGEWTHYGSGLAVDGTGNSYAIGYLDDGFADLFPTVAFDEDTSLTNTNDGYGTFLATYDTDGNALWAELLESSRACYSTAVTLDADGNIYVGGSFRESLRIQTTQFTNGGEKDGFLAKFNNAGVLQWAHQVSGASDCSTLGVSANIPGVIYTVGGFGGGMGDTACFNSSICVTNRGGGLIGSGIGDAFLAKYDSFSGAPLWAVGAGSTNSDGFTGVHASPNGNVYVAGGIDGVGIPSGFHVVIAAYDTNGVERWTQSSTGTNGALSWSGPVLDATGNCYVAGWFQAEAAFGSHTLTGLGYWDFFLAKVGNDSLPLTLGIQWDDSRPRLSVTGEIGTHYVLEYSSAVPATVWHPFLTNTISISPQFHWDESVADESALFYRARLLSDGQNTWSALKDRPVARDLRWRRH